MRLPWRRDREAEAAALPDEVVTAAGVRRRDVMAHASLREDDRWALATRDRLLVVAPGGLDGPDEPGRSSVLTHAWLDLDLAEWDAEESRLVLVPSDPDGEPLTLPLEDTGELLVVVRERLSATLVLERHAVVGGRQVSVVCRRSPTGDLVWRVRYAEGVDADDPAVRRAAAGLLERARDEVGDTGSQR